MEGASAAAGVLGSKASEDVDGLTHLWLTSLR